MNDDLQYKPNSHKFKDEQEPNKKKEVQKVVKGKVKVKKKTEAHKFADIFISEDAANVKSYIFMDVLVPAIKKAISDIVTDGIDMILYGGNGRGKRKTVGSTISYRDYYDKKDSRYDYRESRNRAGYDYDDIILESRGEAENVLLQMDELISTYDSVSIADLYDLVGMTSNNYLHNKYGWTNIRNAEPIRVRNGYLLKLPKAQPLND